MTARSNKTGTVETAAIARSHHTPKTAFVLSGGGSLGAIQVGMLQALADNDIVADLLIGTSVGAVNAAFVAGHGTGPESLANLRRIWEGLNRSNVFPLDPLRLGAAAIGHAPSLCRPDALRHLVQKHLNFENLEEATIALQVVATDVRSGLEVPLSKGNAVQAILASAAIPAVFPSVRIGDQDLVDGGVADNASISQAVASGAERIYLLPTGYACSLDQAPSTPLSSALHALTILIEQRMITDVARWSKSVDIRIVPPLCPLSVSSTDFRRAADLIERADASTRHWLARAQDSAHPEQVLSLHTHPRTHRSHSDRSSSTLIGSTTK